MNANWAWLIARGADAEASIRAGGPDGSRPPRSHRIPRISMTISSSIRVKPRESRTTRSLPPSRDPLPICSAGLERHRRRARLPPGQGRTGPRDRSRSFPRRQRRVRGLRGVDRAERSDRRHFVARDPGPQQRGHRDRHDDPDDPDGDEQLDEREAAMTCAGAQSVSLIVACSASLDVRQQSSFQLRKGPYTTKRDAGRHPSVSDQLERY